MTRAVLGTLAGLFIGTLLAFLVLSNRGMDPRKATMLTTIVGITFGIAGALIATKHSIRAFIDSGKDETPSQGSSGPSSSSSSSPEA